MTFVLAMVAAHAADEDPRLWLEEVDSDQAMEWVKARNEETVAQLSTTEGFGELEARLLEILESDDRIPYVSKRGEYLYNLWKDSEHPKGLWRRTTLASYKTDSPKWEVLLDIDALNEKEGENWVWHGSDCLYPAYTRCLISLSRGGADADVIREFDLESKSFVEGGFSLPEAKGSATWIDLDHLFVQTDFGEGSQTESGYPRIAKRWTRGTKLAEAEMVFEGKTSDISVGAYHDSTPGYERDFAYRSPTFFTNELYELTAKGAAKIDKPDDASAFVLKDRILFELRKDWTVNGKTYQAGSLLASNYKKWKKGKRNLEVIFEPTETTSLASVTSTQSHVVLTVLDTVKTRILIATPGKQGWVAKPLEGLPKLARVSARAVDPLESDALWLTVTDYTTPTSLWWGQIGGAAPKKLKQTPEFFDAEGITVSQHMATSKDGTKIPYFQVAPEDMPKEGAPTLLYGYGGFEVSLLPRYSAAAGAAWLEKGGVYVVANIRGGGEFGPRWHQAALKEKRHKAYEDFAAVGEDLVNRGITTVPQLGIQGGSNGGLLMGNMYTQYPDHWGAVVCQVPLLDMKRYTKLLAGASWAGEYGDPDDPEQWAFIKDFSPYHNIDADTEYPPILFTTSTRDDRVHPGHARKMAHALLEADKDVSYYENIEGGHGGAADQKQRAFMLATSWSFLWNQLTGVEEEQVEDAPEEE